MQCAYCQHVYVLPLLYRFMPLWYIIVCCILSAAEHLQALPLVHIIIVCLYFYFIPADRLPHARSCHRYIILYASGTAQLRCGTLSCHRYGTVCYHCRLDISLVHTKRMWHLCTCVSYCIHNMYVCMLLASYRVLICTVCVLHSLYT